MGALNRLRRRPSLAPVLSTDAVATGGPSSAAIETMVDRGHSHGHRQSRWEPVEELIRQLTELALHDAMARSEIRQLQARNNLGRLRAQQSRAKALLERSEQGSHVDDLFADLRRRRIAAAHDALVDRANAAEEAVDHATVELQNLDSSLESELRAIRESAALLWTAYRVAYVEALPGRPDAQRVGPRIPVNFTVDIPLPSPPKKGDDL